MTDRRRTGFFLVAGLLLLLQGPKAQSSFDPPDDDALFFEQKVLPLLEARCQGCHGEDVQKAGLRLDGRAFLLQGGESGPALEPGDPDASLLIEAVRYDSAVQMPPKSKLPDGEIAILVDWVKRGASWPADLDLAPDEAPAPAASDFDLEARAQHWSFQPLATVEPSEVENQDWPLQTIDRFILSRLEREGLPPAEDADRRTWLRRVSFGLTGLPPSPEELADFLADDSPTAYEKVVDRLLASPRYGERWARHWLDLVRFAETSGHEFDYDIPNAWRYRDYVIRALNADLPFDQFVTEHIAGDLIPEPRRHPSEGTNESVLATGFFFLNEGTHSPVDVLEDQAARVDNQIDVLSKTFLGLTVACARCHDHKFDPITARDYYAMAGYLQSSRFQQAFLDPPGEQNALINELDSIRAQIASRIESTRETDQEPTPESIPGSIVFASFDSSDYSEWLATGPAFGDGPSSQGSIRVEPADPARLFAIPEGIAHSGLVADALRGVLRSPSFVIEHPYIAYLASGRSSRINLVVDGFEKIRDPIYGRLTFDVNHGDEPRWYVQDVSMWLGHRAYIELSDGATIDYRASQSSIPGGEGYLAVDEIRFASQPHAPAVPVDRKPLAIEAATCGPEAARLLDRYRELAAQIGPPTLGLAMVDGSAVDVPIHFRGSTKNLGDPTPRRFLEVLGGESVSPEPSGSGRLALARQIVDPSNPLTARVLVNRLWHHHFGAGIVPTPDDFGHMGQPPSHPELLDWLARDFVENGWSWKRVHRMIVLSRTYRQRSVGDSAADEKDPNNRLLHRANLRRLEAEAIRDALLAVSGRLDSTMGGPSVAPHLTPFMEGRGRPSTSGPLDGDGRRTLYVNVRRNFLPPFLQAFDFPTPASSVGRRNVSNVPAQALALLNDPFVVQQANVCAHRIINDWKDDDARLNALYLSLFSRPPTETERTRALNFLRDLDPHSTGPGITAWAELCHALFNAKEFLYLP